MVPIHPSKHILQYFPKHSIPSGAPHLSWWCYINTCLPLVLIVHIKSLLCVRCFAKLHAYPSCDSHNALRYESLILPYKWRTKTGILNDSPKVIELVTGRAGREPKLVGMIYISFLMPVVTKILPKVHSKCCLFGVCIGWGGHGIFNSFHLMSYSPTPDPKAS